MKTFPEINSVESAHAFLKMLYDAGCAYALAGKPDDALRMLERVGELGEVRVDKIAWDPELVSLRTDPRFTALLERMRQTLRVRS